MTVDAAYGEDIWFADEDFRLRNGLGDHGAVGDGGVDLVEEVPGGESKANQNGLWRKHSRTKQLAGVHLTVGF